MIEKLTEKQKEKMLKTRDYWIDKVYGCEPTDEQESKKLINYLYGLSGLANPKIIFADSPISAQIIANNIVKDSENASIKESISNSIYTTIGRSIRASVLGSIRDSVGISVRAPVSASVGSVRDLIRDSVRDFIVTSSVRDSVRDSVNAFIGRVLKDSVRVSIGWTVNTSIDPVRDSVRDFIVRTVNASAMQEYTPLLYYAEAWSQGWQPFYDFFTRQTKLIEHKEFEKYINLVDKANAYYILPFNKVCIVTRAPKYINRAWHNNRWVMHNSEGKMAIEWGDGWGQYVLHGINLEKEMYEEIIEGSATFEKVMSIQNMEHRMLYLKYLNVDEMLSGAKAELLSTGEKPSYQNNKKGIPEKVTYNRLYLIKDIFETDEYFLRYEDPSTGRVYLSGIDPEIGAKKDADLAMAWKFSISKEEYMELKIEA